MSSLSVPSVIQQMNIYLHSPFAAHAIQWIVRFFPYLAAAVKCNLKLMLRLLVLVNSWMPLKANGMSQLASLVPYPREPKQSSSRAEQQHQLPHSEVRCCSAADAVPGGVSKRDLHAAEMFIVNCCRQRTPRSHSRCSSFSYSSSLFSCSFCSSLCSSSPSCCPCRLGAQMSTAQSADVYIESHFGCQTARRGRG